jgi:hypothetical protein
MNWIGDAAAAAGLGQPEVQAGKTLPPNTGPGQAAGAAIGGAVAQVAQQATAMAAGAGQMLASAKSGGFSITEEACNTWIQALAHCLDVLDRVQVDVIQIQQAPKLGGTYGAKIVGPFTHNVATDSQGIAQSVTNSRATLKQMLQSFQQIKQSYQNTNDQVEQSFKNMRS